MKLALILALLAAPAVAKTPVWQSGDGFFVYQEDKSCTLYVDLESDSMVRISDRRDEGRAYFSIYNPKWQMAEQQGLSIELVFPTLERAHASVGLSLRHPDGRMGFSAADIAGDDFFDDFERADKMIVRVNGRAIEALDIKGSEQAVLELDQCSEKHFAMGAR